MMLIKLQSGDYINSDYIVRIFGDEPFIEMAHRVDETGRRSLPITDVDIKLITHAAKHAQVKDTKQFMN